MDNAILSRMTIHIAATPIGKSHAEYHGNKQQYASRWTESAGASGDASPTSKVEPCAIRQAVSRYAVGKTASDWQRLMDFSINN